MCAEPSGGVQASSEAGGYPRDSGDGNGTATYATRTLPVLRALDAVLAEDAAGLALVLAAAEAERPGVTAALTRAFAAEAAHLRSLAERVEAAVARLRDPHLPGRDRADATAQGPTLTLNRRG